MRLVSTESITTFESSYGENSGHVGVPKQRNGGHVGVPN